MPGLLSVSLKYGLGIEACPICGESDTMDSPELVTHALEHMHQFSLLSLPWSIEELDLSLDGIWFRPSHPRLLRSPNATNTIDQRNGSQAESFLDRLVRWLESDAVDTSKYGADSKKSLRIMNREQPTQAADYFTDKNHIYFAELTTIASVHVGATERGSDLGEAGKSCAAEKESEPFKHASGGVVFTLLCYNVALEPKANQVIPSYE